MPARAQSTSRRLNLDETASPAREHEQVKVIPAALGARTGLVGAAQVWYNRFT